MARKHIFVIFRFHHKSNILHVIFCKKIYLNSIVCHNLPLIQILRIKTMSMQEPSQRIITKIFCLFNVKCCLEINTVQQRAAILEITYVRRSLLMLKYVLLWTRSSKIEFRI